VTLEKEQRRAFGSRNTRKGAKDAKGFRGFRDLSFALFALQTAPALQDATQVELDALLLSVLDRAFRGEL